MSADTGGRPDPLDRIPVRMNARPKVGVPGAAVHGLTETKIAKGESAMKARALVTLIALTVILSPALAAMAETPLTLQVTIGDNLTVSPSKFRVTKGQLVRLVVVNHSTGAHGLQSNQTQDVIFTRPGETKVLEFRATEIPVTFFCKLPGHTEKVEIGAGQEKR
jgi:uncharacterized cupredoxin-like copper-binding protein